MTGWFHKSNIGRKEELGFLTTIYPSIGKEKYTHIKAVHDSFSRPTRKPHFRAVPLMFQFGTMHSKNRVCTDTKATFSIRWPKSILKSEQCPRRRFHLSLSILFYRLFPPLKLVSSKLQSNRTRQAFLYICSNNLSKMSAICCAHLTFLPLLTTSGRLCSEHHVSR